MANNTNVRKSGKNKDYIIWVIWMIIGIVILAGGVIYAYRKWEFKKNAVEISATIVDIQSEYDSDGDIDYTVYVSYEYDKQQYEHINLGFYSSSMYVGKKITVLCDPDNPYKIESSKGIIIGSVGLIVMGLAFITLGIFISPKKGKRRYKNLLETGRCIMAKVDYVDHNTNLLLKGVTHL